MAGAPGDALGRPFAVSHMVLLETRAEGTLERSTLADKAGENRR